MLNTGLTFDELLATTTGEDYLRTLGALGIQDLESNDALTDVEFSTAMEDINNGGSESMQASTNMVQDVSPQEHPSPTLQMPFRILPPSYSTVQPNLQQRPRLPTSGMPSVTDVTFRALATSPTTLVAPNANILNLSQQPPSLYMGALYMPSSGYSLSCPSPIDGVVVESDEFLVGQDGQPRHDSKMMRSFEDMRG
ncbi:hypothetical protein HDU67_004170, partial [Dinochytrium kinnereticum]